MKLDRNTNRGGRGKYALVNMRKLIPILDASQGSQQDTALIEAFNLLLRKGIISLGGETPGDQFFVMKYKDKFTASGLQGYAHAVAGEATARQDHGLKEFADQMFLEARAAEKLGNRIPD